MLKKIFLILTGSFFIMVSMVLAVETAPADKTAAMLDRRTVQYEKHKAARQKSHEKNMSALTAKLANNNKMTPEQKEEFIGFMESQYKENEAFRDAQHQENAAFFKKIGNDETLTKKQKKEALRKHFADQRTKMKEYVSQQRAQDKAEIEKIRTIMQSEKTDQAAKAKPAPAQQ